MSAKTEPNKQDLCQIHPTRIEWAVAQIWFIWFALGWHLAMLWPAWGMARSSRSYRNAPFRSLRALCAQAKTASFPPSYQVVICNPQKCKVSLLKLKMPKLFLATGFECVQTGSQIRQTATRTPKKLEFALKKKTFLLKYLFWWIGLID